MTDKELKNGLEMKNNQKSSTFTKILYNKREGNCCPSCKSSPENFQFEGRCVTCKVCGWSRCVV